MVVIPLLPSKSLNRVVIGRNKYILRKLNAEELGCCYTVSIETFSLGIAILKDSSWQTIITIILINLRNKTACHFILIFKNCYIMHPV